MSYDFVSVAPKKVNNPTRFWGDTQKCTESDILVNQGPGAPLPSGIPTYTVEITNACVSGCDIAQIHMRCGWFSSARLIDPQIFKRLQFNDCLVNGGRPLLNGQSLTFQYANTYSYPLAVSSMSCLDLWQAEDANETNALNERGHEPEGSQHLRLRERGVLL
ncbi:hypothetical protein Cgig2_005572 [Carnegiea gigantea]|uniref:Uncharacterized protein n=1 Tax=Carnegiea gigantea TaxID=171969 RepID=A0A9Q1QRE7_9CARY|nr:hypothetical protein Cgig2_005572 [Carnegiea gigantea]